MIILQAMSRNFLNCLETCRITEDLWNSTRPRVFVTFMCGERWKILSRWSERKLLQKLSQLVDSAWLLDDIRQTRQTKRPSGQESTQFAPPRQETSSTSTRRMASCSAPCHAMPCHAMPVCAEALERGILSSMIDLSNSLHHYSLREKWGKMRKDEKEQHVFKLLGSLLASLLASFQAFFALIPMALQILEK